MNLFRISTFLFLLSSLTFANSSVDAGTIELNAVAGKAFAVNLPKFTGVQGSYSIIKGPQWVELTEEGILFGTAAQEHIGKTNEVFVAALVGATENLYHVNINVKTALPPVKYAFNARIDQVFKADLKALSKLNGKYAFTNLPKWLNGMENGVLVGLPKKTDLGTSLIKVTVDGGDKVYSFDISVDVKNTQITTPPTHPAPGKPMQLKVGQPVKVHVTHLAGYPNMHHYGYFTNLPDFLYLDSKGFIRGTPTEEDKGRHEIYIRVHQGPQVTLVRIKVEVL